MTEMITENIPSRAEGTPTPLTSPNTPSLPESSIGDEHSLAPSWRQAEVDRLVDLIAGKVPTVLMKQAKKVAEEIASLYLQALSGPVEMSPACRIRIGFFGQAWSATELPLEDVLAYFSDFTSRVTDALLRRAHPTTEVPVSDILGLTNQITREFFLGVSRARMNKPSRPAVREVRNPAVDLLAGRQLPIDAAQRLAARYLIVVVRHTPDRADARFVRMMRTVGGDGTFLLPGATETVALVPVKDPERIGKLPDDLDRLLGGQDWIAAAERDRSAIPDGYREAADILDLVCASQGTPQVYRLEDVLLEFASLRNDEVSNALSSVLKPLLSHSMLYETLAALVRSDFNRNATAKSLFIHRTTMDYRLDRIRELTGHEPMSGLGVQLFSAAISLHATATADSVARSKHRSVRAG